MSYSYKFEITLISDNEKDVNGDRKVFMMQYILGILKAIFKEGKRVKIRAL